MMAIGDWISTLNVLIDRIKDRLYPPFS